MTTVATTSSVIQRHSPSRSARYEWVAARICSGDSQSITWQLDNKAFDTVAAVFRESNRPDWDGYGAKPVSPEACTEAVKFISNLPVTFPMPQVIAEPDGDLALEWYVKKSHLFVIGFSGKGSISYNGVFGQDTKIHGCEPLTDELPRVVCESIRRLLAFGNPS